jgi:hypothetical protein
MQRVNYLKVDDLAAESGSDGTVEFSSEIAKSLNFTAEHTENAKAPESLNNDWNSLKILKLCILCALRGDKSLDF